MSVLYPMIKKEVESRLERQRAAREEFDAWIKYWIKRHSLSNEAYRALSYLMSSYVIEGTLDADNKAEEVKKAAEICRFFCKSCNNTRTEDSYNGGVCSLCRERSKREDRKNKRMRCSEQSGN